MKSLMLLALVALPFLSKAQAVEMADTLRGSGKIYIVVGVIVIIFIGIVVYLFTLDRRISKIEGKK